MEAYFEAYTGGDAMASGTPVRGMDVVVRDGSTVRRVRVATCAHPQRGTALGGGTERELDVALCGGTLWLVSEPGVVRVLRGSPDAGAPVAARFPLSHPAARAVAPGP